jgi:glycopeptide antibiotics resistance protein
LTILLFSLFGRQIWSVGKEFLGQETFLGSGLILGLICSFKVLGFRATVAFAVLLICLYPVLVPEELIHVFLFGSLGYCVFNSEIQKKILLSVCLSIGDELFQWVLPWRVCDPKDMVLNIFCCFIGAVVARAEFLIREKVAV